MSGCKHLDFRADVRVARLLVDSRGPVTGYGAEIKIHCAKCGTPFQFLGLEPGYDSQGARVTLDGLEAHLAITPQGKKPNPMQRMMYGITAHQ